MDVSTGGWASSHRGRMSVDEVLGVKVLVHGSRVTMSRTECVCVCLRRAISLLRVHLSLVATVLMVFQGGVVNSVMYVW